MQCKVTSLLSLCDDQEGIDEAAPHHGDSLFGALTTSTIFIPICHPLKFKSLDTTRYHSQPFKEGQGVFVKEVQIRGRAHKRIWRKGYRRKLIGQ